MNKRFLVLLLASMLIINFAVYSKAKSETEEVTDEVVTLDVLSLPSNQSGLWTGWGADIVREAIGIELNFLPAGDQGEQKLQALMASGELPDIVVFKDNKQVINAVAGDMLLAFDDNKEFVPHVYEVAENSLNYYADNISDGSGKPYAVGTGLKSIIPQKGNMNWGPSLRYDLYKEIGSPKIETSDDYLDVVKQMQDIYPTNADEKKAYGFSMWGDWDKNYMYSASNLGNINGIVFPAENTLVEIDLNNDNKVSSMLAEDSWYLKGVKMFYDANQMGLFDPDSITQRFGDAETKATAGRTLFSWWTWAYGNFNTTENTEKNIGFQTVMAEDAQILHQGLNPIGKWPIAVSSATEYPEKAFAFVDMLYNGELLMELLNGPKGTVWDVDENGAPYMLEEGYKYTQDSTLQLPEGGTLGAKIGDGSISVINAIGLGGDDIIPEYNNTAIGKNYWIQPDYAPPITNLEKMWREDIGYDSQVEYLIANDGMAVAPFVAYPVHTDDMERLATRIGDVIKTESWKMVYAENEAEYEAIKDAMIERAEGIGLQEYVDWYTEEYAKALEFASMYSQ